MPMFVLNYAANQRGCPLVLRGAINTGWTWGAFNPDLSVGRPSQGYVYQSKHHFLDFDYWNECEMASERFVEICGRFGVGFEPVAVDVLLSNRMSSEKKYFYLRWSAWASIIDLERSDYELERELETGEVAYHKYFPDVPVLATVENFVVDESRLPASAAFKCLDLGHALVCNAEFREACEQAGLVGIQFDDITTYKKADFWG
ncbi:MAG: imm11 family protein [Stenotrophomonas sp.]